jgi:hypothetical protein
MLISRCYVSTVDTVVLQNTEMKKFKNPYVQVVFAQIAPLVINHGQHATCHSNRREGKSLTANANVATVTGSIPASSDTVESERQQMKQC